MYIIQFLICIAQGCVVLEHEPYVMYNDVQLCEVAASVGMNELMILLEGEDVKVAIAHCVDKSKSIV